MTIPPAMPAVFVAPRQQPANSALRSARESRWNKFTSGNHDCPRRAVDASRGAG